MKHSWFPTLGLCFATVFCAVMSAPAITFTNDVTIHSFDTNYDGQGIVVSNCTLTVNGPHTFASLLVIGGGKLTHTYSSSGTVFAWGYFTDEPWVLNGTNAITLLHSGTLGEATVTDLGKTITYTNDVDYSFTYSGIDIQLQRTTNSTIPDGATVLVSYLVQVATPAGVNLIVNGTVEIAAGAAIDVNGRGYGGNIGIGNGGETFTSPISGAGAGYGGYGGVSSSNAPAGTSYGSFTQPTDLGSGGGYGSGGAGAVGGTGGGAIKILALDNMIIDGVISANGANATNNRSGGGAGGSIWFSAPIISGAGTITANGGAGEPIHGGGGGGGRIALTADTNNFAGTITAFGGAGAQKGGAGTIYAALTAQPGSVLLDNGGAVGAVTPLQVANGADVTLRGRAVGGISTSQTIGKLLVASNSTVTALSVNGPFVTIVCTDATVESSGQITTDGQSTLSSPGTGMGAQSGGVSYCGGGGHGGAGGMGGHTFARGGGTYDSSRFPGSAGGMGGGSGSSFPPFGGAAGGVIRLTVNGTLNVAGSISSDGKSGSGAYAGGGAGGSVWLTLGTWSGSGRISANGAPGLMPGGGGGGGGRIAIYFNTNSFIGQVTAYGGTGTNNGGAGTIYLNTNSQSFAQLIIDNGGNSGTNTTFDSPISADLTLAGKAAISVPGLSLHSLLIRSNATLNGITGTSPSQLTVTASGNVTIDPGGALTMDGLGYGPAQGNGPGYTGASFLLKGGGGHGGYGGANPGTGNFGSAYGLVTIPTVSGSGGGNGSGSSFSPLGGAGGGVLNVNVTGTLTVNGKLSANGKDGEANSGGGAGGSLNINCGSLLGSGLISANGGVGNGLAGGGGGGRVALQFNSNSFSGALTAAGGTGMVGGGAGTIYSRLKSLPIGEVLVSNGGMSGTNTPLSTSFGLPGSPFNLTISGGASILPTTSLPLLSNLTIGANSLVTVLPNQTSLAISVARDVNIAPGGGISVAGKGYGRGAGPGPGGSIANKGAGGGYGGIGGASGSGATGGTNYGSATQPIDRGSGGGAGANTFVGGSDGGGALRLTVGGTLKVDGALDASGNPGLQDDSGGGAGGSIWITANALSGSGTIAAGGGPGELFGGGGGGGGRIAIYSPSNAFTGSYSTAGGLGANIGEPGTLVLSGTLPSILGTITDTNGQPVAGVTLQANLGGASTTSGVDGTYTLALVPYAGFTVTPVLPGSMFVPGSRAYAAAMTTVSNQDYLAVNTIAATLASSLQGTNVAVNWYGIAGVSYQLYYSSNLVNWLPYGAPIVGASSPIEVPVPVDSDPAKFFRVNAGN